MAAAHPIYLAGPTGSGKSAIAIALARRLGDAVVVNADAFQLYRGIEILSAAPSSAGRASVPHRLYGVLALGETCDAARYASMAHPLIAELCARGVTPLVTGGSGLYLKALTHGLAQTPPGDAGLRKKLDALSLDALVAWFRQIDPDGAAATNLKNRRYVTRNLEISLLSGRPASELKRSFATERPDICGFVLQRDRSDLYRRIDLRTSELFREGAREEVRAIDFSRLSVTAEKAIGLREIRAHLEGQTSEAECLDAIAQATRRYAKRQETWFRRESCLHSISLSPDETPESAAEKILRQLNGL